MKKLVMFLLFGFLGLSAIQAQVEKKDIRAFARQMMEKGLIPKSEYEKIIEKVDSMSEQQLKDANQVGKMHKSKVKDGDKAVSNDLDVAAQNIDTNSDQFKSMSEALKLIFEKQADPGASE